MTFQLSFVSVNYPILTRCVDILSILKSCVSKGLFHPSGHGGSEFAIALFACIVMTPFSGVGGNEFAIAFFVSFTDDSAWATRFEQSKVGGNVFAKTELTDINAVNVKTVLLIVVFIFFPYKKLNTDCE